MKLSALAAGATLIACTSCGTPNGGSPQASNSPHGSGQDQVQSSQAVATAPESTSTSQAAPLDHIKGSVSATAPDQYTFGGGESSQDASTPSPVLPPSTPVASSPESEVPAAQALPYHADWKTGLDGWAGDTAEWSVSDGHLIGAGKVHGIDTSLVAPVQLLDNPDYVVDTDMEFVRHTDAGVGSGIASFGVVLRANSDDQGYGVGHCVSAGIFTCAAEQTTQNVAGIWDRANKYTPRSLGIVPFTPAPGSTHHFQITVKGNSVKLAIDGTDTLKVTDNAYSQGGRVGLWADRTQVVIKGFTIKSA